MTRRLLTALTMLNALAWGTWWVDRRARKEALAKEKERYQRFLRGALRNSEPDLAERFRRFQR